MASRARSLPFVALVRSRLALEPTLLAALAVAGCETPPTPDAGTDTPIALDTPPPVPYTCEGDPTVINGVLGETETVMFDTTMTTTRPRDLGLNCGNTGAEVRWARQEVIEYHVPGTGPVAVEFSAVNDGTLSNFDTLIQVRTDCTSVPTLAFPPTCFDNSTMTEVRSAGAYQAMGGDVFYLIVTGHSDPEPVSGDVDEGMIRVQVTPRANTPPTIESASSILVGPANVISARGDDAEGPIFGFALELYTAAGQIDFDGNGELNHQDVLLFQWESVTGAGPYDATSTITPDMDGYQLAAYCRAVGCTEAGIALFDQQYAASTFLRVPVTDALVVGNGEVCDLTHVCATGLECFTGTCRITPAAQAACDAAMVFPITAPTEVGVPTMASVTGAITRGAGVFSSPCSGGMDPVADSVGREAIYRLDLPSPGTYRVNLTTARPGTGTADTLLYVRGADCWDGRTTTSLGCNDDIGSGMLQSNVDLMMVGGGTYYVFVEFFGGAPAASSPFELQATVTLTMAGDAGMPVDAGMPDAGDLDAGDLDAGDLDAGVDAPK